MKVTEQISEAEAKKLVADEHIEPTQVAISYEGTGFAPTVHMSISGMVVRSDEDGEHLYFETFYSAEEVIDDDYPEPGHVNSFDACMSKIGERLSLLGYKLGTPNKSGVYYSVVSL